MAAFKRQLATLRDKIASVDTDIEQYRVVTQNLKRGASTCFLGCSIYSNMPTEKNKERATLRTHASQLEELSACEDLLGFMIEGVEKDQLLVRFTKLDASDPEREATFVIDVGGEFFRGTQARFYAYGHSLTLHSDYMFPTATIYVFSSEQPQRKS